MLGEMEGMSEGRAVKGEEKGKTWWSWLLVLRVHCFAVPFFGYSKE